MLNPNYLRLHTPHTSFILVSAVTLCKAATNHPLIFPLVKKKHLLVD